MLLVTFHGSSAGLTNVYAYDTVSGQLNTQTALQNAQMNKAELRGLVYANSLLYVVNGKISTSTIMCFQPPAPGSTEFNFAYIGDFIGPLLSKKGNFKTSIGHPYAMQFDSAGFCYVSNQDTNVVAQASVAPNFQTATVSKGCRSSYLKGLTSICPQSGCVYLDGTFVASQNGTLPNVDVVATNVPSANGGLAIKPPTDIQTVTNSVRDVAVYGEILLVCDEPGQLIRIYSLPAGTYMGAAPVPASPTHLAIFANGLYVSADKQLYWSPLSVTMSPKLKFQSVVTAPSGNKVGGVAFDPATNTAWVAFQDGTGTTGTGTIRSYSLGTPPASPPVFGTGSLFATIPEDTPEFLLFMPNP